MVRFSRRQVSHAKPPPKKRLDYKPPLPPLLKDLTQVFLKPFGSPAHLTKELRKLFPHMESLTSSRVEHGHGKSNRKLTVGVLFSGGQAAGGHNVIAGLFDGLRESIPISISSGS